MDNSQQSTYDLHKTWEANYQDGPIFSGKIPPLPTKKSWKLLGHDIISPLGVAAGPLPNYKWISLYAKLGYGSLVHKTVRTVKHASHPFPNILFIDVEQKLNPDENETVVGHSDLSSIKNLSITNSFGNPCKEPSEWMEEIRKERKTIPDGQLLIVSVYGTYHKGMTPEDFAHDYAKAATLAKEAGAQAIELNLSCPNVLGDEDPYIYLSPEATTLIAKTVKKTIGKTPLILKIGYYDSFQKMIDVLLESKGTFEAISAINTIAKQIVDKNGNEALPGRKVSGVCGVAIKPFTMEMVQQLSKARTQLKLDFEIIATGGVMEPKDIHDYLQAGAQHVHTATGAIFHPYLAYEFAKISGAY